MAKQAEHVSKCECQGETSLAPHNEDGARGQKDESPLRSQNEGTGNYPSAETLLYIYTYIYIFIFIIYIYMYIYIYVHICKYI